MAQEAAERIRSAAFHVEAVEQDRTRRNPTPPFTTASLQQEASRKLGFGVRRTMRIAQALYEGVEVGGETTGLITYMRSDSLRMSRTASGAARRIVRGRFGRDYLPGRARAQGAAAGNAREAHEAIRPTDFAIAPEDLEGRIGGDEARLYDLIWKRAVASRMAAARFDRVRVALASEAGDIVLGATGSETVFDGFLRVYREDGDGDDADDYVEVRLPEMAEGERAFVDDVRTVQRFTGPPARYTEAGLVRRLEELGIGRPSTYAAIVGVLLDREYAVLHHRRFVPTERGRVVTAFLDAFFADWVAYGFTAGLERDLDRIAGGTAAWQGILEEFWGDFEKALEEAGTLRRREVLAAIAGGLESFAFSGADREGGRTCRLAGECVLAAATRSRGRAAARDRRERPVRRPRRGQAPAGVPAPRAGARLDRRNCHAPRRSAPVRRSNRWNRNPDSMEASSETVVPRRIRGRRTVICAERPTLPHFHAMLGIASRYGPEGSVRPVKPASASNNKKYPASL